MHDCRVSASISGTAQGSGTPTGLMRRRKKNIMPNRMKGVNKRICDLGASLVGTLAIEEWQTKTYV